MNKLFLVCSVFILAFSTAYCQIENCESSIGTFSVEKNGELIEYSTTIVIENGESLMFTPNGDAILPPAAEMDGAGIGYAFFSCNPSNLDLEAILAIEK